MDSKRLAPDQADTADMRATNLRAYLDQLIDNLDDSSLRATLKLMICEARGAIRKHQELIALERLDRRDTAGRTDRLRELGATVQTGRFRAHMGVELINDGPVTLLLEI